MKNDFYIIGTSFLETGLKVKENFDATEKLIKKGRKEYKLFYLTTLTDNLEILAITQSIIEADKEEIDKIILNGAVSKSENLNDILRLAFSGVGILFVKGKNYALLIESRNYNTRSPSEPDSEKTIRGSKDGFTESINDNVAAIRRRIRSSELVIKLKTIGKKSKLDVAMIYLENKAETETIKKLEEKINKIHVESLVMSDRALEEEMFPQKLNPFPLVRYTERPDIASINLMRGKVLFVVDTSPSVIITPITIFDHYKSVEEYRQTPLIGSLIKFIRTISILLSIFLIPLWYVMVQETNISNFFIIQPTSADSLIPIFLQVLIAEFFVEIISLAVIHTPNALTSTIGIVAAIIMGSVSIDLNIFLPEVLVYVAFSAISSYSTPSYELSLANRLVKYFLFFLAVLFGSSGLIIGTLLLFCYLAHIKELDRHYLSPLLPLNVLDLFKILFRKSKKDQKIL